MGRLVLTRRVGRGLVLFTSDGPVRIRFARSSGGSGFKAVVEAPEAVRVLRGELPEALLAFPVDAGPEEGGGHGGSRGAA